MTPELTLLCQLGTLLVAIVGATWVLLNKIAAGHAELTEKIATGNATLAAKISELQTDIAVMKKSEENRDEKINKMWSWWLKALEEGWTAAMRSNMNKGRD